jgi:peptidoglycan/xylan/chitin deacetylase (PgdA/CDA1 family)
MDRMSNDLGDRRATDECSSSFDAACEATRFLLREIRRNLQGPIWNTVPRLSRVLTDVAATFRSAHVVVLCYHRVRNRQRFVDQLAALSARGYSVLSMPQFTSWLQGSPLRSRPAALLTFDHCYDEQLENAVPVLDSFKFPATFFPLSAGLADRRPDVAGPGRSTLLALTKAGHTIGCHTHAHPVLTRLSSTRVRQEVLGSKLALEDALGQRVSAFCYPHGANDARVRAIVREAGFDVAFTVDLGGVNPGDDPFKLKRVPVLGEPGSAEFAGYLAGRFLVSGSMLLSWKVRERLLDRAALQPERDG